MAKMKFRGLSALAGALCLIAPAFLGASASSAPILEIRNQSSSEILNILVEPEKGKEGKIFLRLDLAPGAAGKIENPDCRANLRVDTGVQFWLYENVNLAGARGLLFCQDYPGCLAIRGEDGQLVHEAVGLRDLIPPKGSRPVCELGSFHPLMPMRDVCALLDPDVPRDDNGSCLASLGFAGKLWAARLAPFQDGPITDNSLLEHMELRKALSRQDVDDVLSALAKKGYSPWQAEFPGKDMDFAEMKGVDAAGRMELLNKAVSEFLEHWEARKPSPQVNNEADEEAEASILLAPADMLPALANADMPAQDVQLFTVVLKPLSSTLLLDVSAYKGE